MCRIVTLLHWRFCLKSQSKFHCVLNKGQIKDHVISKFKYCLETIVYDSIGLLIDNWKSGYRILAPISGYANTHTIIENGVQTVRVCAACLAIVDTVKHDMLPLWPPATAAATDICHI